MSEFAEVGLADGGFVGGEDLAGEAPGFDPLLASPDELAEWVSDRVDEQTAGLVEQHAALEERAARAEVESDLAGFFAESGVPETDWGATFGDAEDRLMGWMGDVARELGVGSADEALDWAMRVPEARELLRQGALAMVRAAVEGRTAPPSRSVTDRFFGSQQAGVDTPGGYRLGESVTSRFFGRS